MGKSKGGESDAYQRATEAGNEGKEIIWFSFYAAKDWGYMLWSCWSRKDSSCRHWRSLGGSRISREYHTRLVAARSTGDRRVGEVRLLWPLTEYRRRSFFCLFSNQTNLIPKLGRFFIWQHTVYSPRIQLNDHYYYYQNEKWSHYFSKSCSKGLARGRCLCARVGRYGNIEESI